MRGFYARAAMGLAFSLFVVVPAAAKLIALDSNRSVYEVNQTTGVKTQLGTLSSNVGTAAGLAYDAIGNRLWVTSSGNDALYLVNMTTWEGTLVGNYGPNVVMHGLEYDSRSGKLYAASSTPNSFYEVSPTTGAATLVADLGLSSFNNLGYDSLNDQMYLTNSGTDSLYRINRSTGATTLVGALNFSSNPNGLAYNWRNNKMYLVDNSTDNLYTLNLATGNADLVGAMGAGNLLGLAYVEAVPEPGTLLALGAGLALLARRRRR